MRCCTSTGWPLVLFCLGQSLFTLVLVYLSVVSHFILKVSPFGGRSHGHLMCGVLKTVPGTSWTWDPWERWRERWYSYRGFSLYNLEVPGNALLHQLIHWPSLASCHMPGIRAVMLGRWGVGKELMRRGSQDIASSSGKWSHTQDLPF